jgi:hypothetical protein
MERKLNVKMKRSKKDADWKLRFPIGFFTSFRIIGYVACCGIILLNFYDWRVNSWKG